MIFITYTLGKKYDNRTRLLFTDTDSLVYKIKIDDAYEDFYENLILVTIQKIKKFFWSCQLKNCNCKMKDEVKWKIISEFVENQKCIL